jgi:glucokinase
MILAGDIGGTKTVLALFEESGDDLKLVRDGTFPSKQHASLEAILEKFLQEGPKPALKACCFGVAGAVIEGKCKTTNLPWQLDEVDLARAVGAPRAKLLNDLEAAAYGMLFLKADELCVLNPGVQPKRHGNIAVLAAGTGLGEAMLYWDGKHHHPCASEGGHSDFAPRNDREIDLLRYLQAELKGHVSCERVLSGPGSVNIYRFLRDRGHYPEPPELTARIKAGDLAVVFTQAGLAGEFPICVEALNLFSNIYGAEAGNLALKCMAIGGVFVGGGIAPKMLPILQNGSFLQGFFDKGRFTDLMKSIEVKVALNPRAPLIGAAHYALRLI